MPSKRYVEWGKSVIISRETNKTTNLNRMEKKQNKKKQNKKKKTNPKILFERSLLEGKELKFELSSVCFLRRDGTKELKGIRDFCKVSLYNLKSASARVWNSKHT